MTCSNTIQGQQKIDPGAFQEAPEMFCMSQVLNATQTECVSQTEEHRHEVYGVGNFHELLLKTTVDSDKPKVHKLISFSQTSRCTTALKGNF